MRTKPPSSPPALKISGADLFDLDYLPFLPPNNAPHYIYGPGPQSICEHTVEVPIREQSLWCPVCKITGSPEPSLLRRVYTTPGMFEVWHAHDNMATGQVESDRRRMDVHLADASKRAEDRLTGTPANFVRTDYTELKSLKEQRGGNTDEGMRSTHDRAVTEGRKESKGRFVM